MKVNHANPLSNVAFNCKMRPSAEPFDYATAFEAVDLAELKAGPDTSILFSLT